MARYTRLTSRRVGWLRQPTGRLKSDGWRMVPTYYLLVVKSCRLAAVRFFPEGVFRLARYAVYVQRHPGHRLVCAGMVDIHEIKPGRNKYVRVRSRQDFTTNI